jgi:hypothetical protein
MHGAGDQSDRRRPALRSISMPRHCQAAVRLTPCRRTETVTGQGQFPSVMLDPARAAIGFRLDTGRRGARYGAMLHVRLDGANRQPRAKFIVIEARKLVECRPVWREM